MAPAAPAEPGKSTTEVWTDPPVTEPAAPIIKNGSAKNGSENGTDLEFWSKVLIGGATVTITAILLTRLLH